MNKLSHLSGVEVDEAVSSWLPLQRSRLVEQKVKLLHMAELLQQLHQMEPGEEQSRWEYQVTESAGRPRQRLTPSLPNQHLLLLLQKRMHK